MSEQPPSPSAVPPDAARKYDEELVNPPQEKTVEPVSAAELKAGADQRAKQRPLLQKILAVFKNENKGAYR